MEMMGVVADLDRGTIADWASIVSLAFTLVSLFMIASVKRSLFQFRRGQRVRQLIQEIKTIPDDALPLSNASVGKLESLQTHLSSAWWPFFWMGRCLVVRRIQKSIKNSNIAQLKEGLDDYLVFRGNL